MGSQDANMANVVVYDFLIRNSFHDIAFEFKETLRHQNDLKIQDAQEDFKLENLADDLFVRSLVYEFLRRKSHARVAFQYQLEFGPFRDLKGLTLEKVFDIYKQKTGIITSKLVTPIDLENSPSISLPLVSNSSKKLPYLVYDYLIRNKHLCVAHELKQITGPLEYISSIAKLEDIFSQYMKNRVGQKAKVGPIFKFQTVLKC